MGRAYITSIDTLAAFRAALAEFATDAADALCAAEAEIRRVESWLLEQQKHWQRELRKRTEDVQRAKNELASRKYQNRDGRGMGSTEQEKALKKAQARLHEAETKLENCRRWAPVFQHAVHEYHGPARQLSGMLEADVVQALAILANKLTALEAYLSMAPPEAPPAPAVGPAEQALPVAVATEAVVPVEPAAPATTEERKEAQP